MRKLQFTHLFFIFIFILYCFDYKETIIVYSNFSGKVQMEYTVPVQKENGTSLLSFFPTSMDKFQEKFAIKPTKFHVMDAKPLVRNFSYKKVVVEFPFQSIEDLETKLVGLHHVIRIGNTVYIQRNFKSISNKKNQNRIFNFFYDYLLQKFKNRTLKFVLKVPSHFDLISNLGKLPYPGILVFQYHLEKTFDPRGSYLWNITIRSNPSP